MSKEKHHHYRFFVPPESISGKNFISQDKELINQIKNVFRLSVGAEILILDNSGKEYVISLRDISKNEVSGEIISSRKKDNNRLFEINLFIPLIKNNNFDLVLEKCTELGIDNFYPIIYDHSVIHKKEKSDRWERIIKEASEQCSRFIKPNIFSPVTFDSALEKIDGTTIIASEDSKNSVEEIISKIKKDKNKKAINIVVGPEGGFSEKELLIIENRGLDSFCLGNNILRAETACIVSLGFFSTLC